MERKCQHCGSTVDEKSQSCPICGKPLPRADKVPSEWPKTIEELKDWYVDHHLPPEQVTRFFIGKNILEPKAFGIYKNEVGEFVVYKNKTDGQRAVRYQGMDEVFAVGEIYQRLRDEMAKQRSRSRAAKGGAQRQPAVSRLQSSSSDGNSSKHTKSSESSKSTWTKTDLFGCGGIIAVVIALLFGVYALSDHTPNGYYLYNGVEYYHQGSSWYEYDDVNDAWFEAESLSKVITSDNADEYSYSGHTGTAFEDTEWYDDDSSSSSDSDDWGDDDWSSDDDWDSGSTDFDDDW